MLVVPIDAVGHIWILIQKHLVQLFSQFSAFFCSHWHHYHRGFQLSKTFPLKQPSPADAQILHVRDAKSQFWLVIAGTDLRSHDPTLLGPVQDHPSEQTSGVASKRMVQFQSPLKCMLCGGVFMAYKFAGTQDPVRRDCCVFRRIQTAAEDLNLSGQ